MSAINLAKEYYIQFHEYKFPRLGPYLNFSKFTIDQWGQLNKINEKYLLKIINENISFNNQNSKNDEFHVPSPWHAWVLLQFLDQKLRNVSGNVSHYPIVDNFSVPAYRGQNNITYKLVPTLYRNSNKDNRDINIKQIKKFSLIFQQDYLWNHVGLKPSENDCLAAAQHHGLCTDLLDITSNPAVAIYFASQCKTSGYQGSAVVFVFDLQTILQSNTKIILPHPINERIYKQYGAFIQLDEETSNSDFLYQNSIKIIFPFDASFQLLNSDNWSDINIYPIDSWIEKLVQWARDPSEIPSDNEIISQVFEEVIGYPNIQQLISLLPNWIDNFENMMYGYAIRISDDYKTEMVLSGVLDNICRNNPEFIKFLLEIYKNFEVRYYVELLEKSITRLSI